MSSRLRRILFTGSILPLLLWCVAVQAHHSAAQFDFSKQITLEGVVKKFIVRNPHAAVVLEISDEKGTRDVEFEGHSASHFYRAGYTRDLVHEGDKMAILIAPRRDGGDGGFITAFTVNGKTVIGFGNLSPETGKSSDNRSGGGQQ